MRKKICFLTLLSVFALLVGCSAGAVLPEEPPVPSPAAPETKPAPSEPAPLPETESLPTPETEQSPTTEPVPETEPFPAPETEQIPTTEPVPETEPNPVPDPSPETEPAPETEPSSQPLPEPEPGDPVEELLRGMTLEEKVAQMLVVTPETLTGVTGAVTVAGETTRAAFDRCPVGGVLYMGKNLQNPEQVRNLCGNMQQISRQRTGLPVFLCVDEEGGSVARISGTGRFGIPAIEDMAEVGASGDPDRAREIGRTIGGYLRDLGFNVDFAPDADVLTEPENQVVRRRSFGSDPELVTEMAAACADGLLEQGILPVYKHFPGHGATAADSHQGYALSPRTLEELLACELLPFRDAAARGIPMIMVGHISLPEVTADGLPASLSPALVTGLLREELGYEGLIITDALGMGAIAQHYTPGEAAVLAVKAGNDLLLVSEHLDESYAALLEAVRSGEIPEERIDESLRRILAVKKDLP